jgi:hypothetical protein
VYLFISLSQPEDALNPKNLYTDGFQVSWTVDEQEFEKLDFKMFSISDLVFLIIFPSFCGVERLRPSQGHVNIFWMKNLTHVLF